MTEQPGPDATDTLKGELEAERKRSQELTMKLKYAQADLENFRKRADRELSEAGEAAVRELLRKLLVVEDELELAVKHTESGEGGEDVAEGVEMVQRNLMSLLRSCGVEKIESMGKPFDPAVHEAVEKVGGDADGEDVVVEVVRPGFTYKGQLLRPSMVRVKPLARENEEAGEHE